MAANSPVRAQGWSVAVDRATYAVPRFPLIYSIEVGINATLIFQTFHCFFCLIR